jgi:hypothetical protein
MAFHPHIGNGLWVTLFKIKIKVIKIKTLIHDFSSKFNIKHIGSGMSSGNFEISGKIQKSLITPIMKRLDGLQIH